MQVQNRPIDTTGLVVSTAELNGQWASIEDINADRAALYLGQKRQNRNLSRQYVDRLSGAMIRGEWEFNGETVKTDQQDKLFDGEHRMNAIILAAQEQENISIRMLVVHGLDPRVVETVDMGRRRTLADMLQLRNEQSARRLASGLVFYWRYVHGALTTRRTMGRTWPTVQQSLDLLEDIPEIRDGITPTDMIYRHTKFLPSAALGTFQILQEVDADDTLRFFDTVAHDYDLPVDDPRSVFRLQVAKEYEELAMRHTRAWAERQSAWAIKAFNDWRQGLPKTEPYRWVPGGGRGEAFPRPV